MCPTAVPPSADSKPRGPAFLTLAALALLGLAAASLLPGCGFFKASGRVVDAVVPGSRSKQADPVVFQVQIQRFADDYSTRTATAVDEYSRRMGTEAARLQGLKWKLAAATAAINIASGPQPKANLLDLVSLAALSRMAIEDSRMKASNGPAFQPWIEACRTLETNAWELASSILDPTQVEELRKAIGEWQAGNPTTGIAFAARPQEFAAMVKSSHQKQAGESSVFSLVGLDPTAGLDPAVHEVTLTRLFAERAMFSMQRMPQLLRWQAELLTYQVASQPAAQTVLTNADRLAESMNRISHAAESVGRVAAELPDRVAMERKAVLAALDQQEGKLRELATEVDRSLVAADKLSGSLTIAITNFDALMKRFGVGEPWTNSAPDTNSPPFNILDYGKAATQIGSMAREINTLVTSVNQSVPQLQQLADRATADTQRVVDRAFRLGLILIGVLLGGAVVAGLIYQKLAKKIRL